MGLFRRRVQDDGGEDTSFRDELRAEVEGLQREFRAAKEEIARAGERTRLVKDEYDATVGSLMEVKRELNEKKAGLELAKSEHAEVLRRAEKLKAGRAEAALAREALERIRGEIDGASAEKKGLDEALERGRSELQGLRVQAGAARQELEEANARLYDAKEELNRGDLFAGPAAPADAEDAAVQGGQPGVIEAASAVVGSLKSKLAMTQKELEAVQLLLEKEREEHDRTKRALEGAGR